MIGCASHRFNLDCKKYLEGREGVLQALMTNKNSKELKIWSQSLEMSSLGSTKEDAVVVVNSDDNSIRTPQEKDIEKLVQLGRNTGIFKVDEAEELLGQTLQDLLNNILPISHQAHLLEIHSTIIGWVYFGPTEEDSSV